ncbi:MAG: type ISP restriction/modification enzyme [Planctomycetota bacterium]|nr:type ISP restriction/modification enzyme [Planctomycetota bacterium]
MVRKTQTDWRDLLAVTAAAETQIAIELPRLSAASPLRLLQARLARHLSPDAANRQLAQALICGRMAWYLAGRRFQETQIPNWLLGQADPAVATIFQAVFQPAQASWLQEVLDVPAWDCACERWAGNTAETLPSMSGLEKFDFLESFLSQVAAQDRSRRGVYYTAWTLARFMVDSVDQSLRQEFDLRSGLASCQSWQSVVGASMPSALQSPDSQRPFVRVLDPACGTGVFLRAVVARIHANWQADFRSGTTNSRSCREAWNVYVIDQLLPRLTGVDWMLPAVVVAQIGLACQLEQTGFEFQGAGCLQISVGNSLAEPGITSYPAAGGEHKGASIGQWSSTPYTVVVGNPPWAALSTNRNSWTDQLLHGRVEDAPADYFAIDGRPLAERKLWLHDDYVKFFRLAHWNIERATTGLVALVTNHGYLENATFRGMRHALSATFSRISLLDLHGNRKSRERPPPGVSDQNLFGIDQGVAVGLLRRLPGPHQQAESVRYSELWGQREDKISRLAETPWSELPAQPVALQSPYYFFSPRVQPPAALSESSFRLPDTMPLHSTAPITARDGLVVALTDEELESRFGDFRDLNIPDDQIREAYFRKTRSARYPPGDTRSWKLPQARQCLAADETWRSQIRDCCYRPFDRRRVYWSETMVDWPRTAVMRHLVQGPNLVLITRRQMLPSQPCNFFWVADRIVLDGVIRSDNRGGESVFPLWVYGYDENGMATGERALNFSGPFLAAMEEATGAALCGAQRPSAETDQTGWELLGYLYGLFHASIYRERYATTLCVDFPPVLIPASAALYRRLSQLGRDLVKCHLGHALSGPGTEEQLPGPHWSVPTEDPLIAAGYPRWQDESVYVSSEACCQQIPLEAWELRVGSYQPCRKWLWDRRGKRLSAVDRADYLELVRGAAQTVTTIRAIDRLFVEIGDWERAFRLNSEPALEAG